MLQGIIESVVFMVFMDIGFYICFHYVQFDFLFKYTIIQYLDQLNSISSRTFNLMTNLCRSNYTSLLENILVTFIIYLFYLTIYILFNSVVFQKRKKKSSIKIRMSQDWRLESQCFVKLRS